MSSTLDILNNLPELNFINNDPEILLAEMIAEYEAAYLAQTGTEITLFPADPIRIFIYTQALKLYQAFMLIDFAAKQNFIRYSSNVFLDALASTRATLTRLEAQKALVTIEFTLSTTFEEAKIIPAGTRVTAGDNVFFVSTENLTIAAGETTGSIEFECTEAGIIGNGYLTGQINTLVDPIAYVQSIENTTTSQGGSDIEDDDSLRERTYLAPEGFAVAGPELAYKARVLNYNQAIKDVSVYSSSPGVVDIRFLLENGEIPDSTLISEVTEHLTARNKRPLTDNLAVTAPTQVDYSINVTYYIDNAYSNLAAEIQANVEEAVEKYILWQKSKIGRDINQTYLIMLMSQAGAKRVTPTAPEFQALSASQVANLSSQTVTYGGLEDA